jgi:glycerol-3-phosphate cytidylyltransferase
MKIGFACGVFDLFHAGHVLMLKECRTNCDKLVVALNSCENIDSSINPNKQTPLYTVAERKLILEACRYVDKVLVYNNEEELKEIMKTGEFDVRFLGEDYKGKSITGADLIPEIHWINRDHGLSTSGYKARLK